MYRDNREPPLDEVFEDPIVHLVLARDKLRVEEVRAQMRVAQMRICEARSFDHALAMLRELATFTPRVHC